MKSSCTGTILLGLILVIPSVVAIVQSFNDNQELTVFIMLILQFLIFLIWLLFVSKAMDADIEGIPSLFALFIVSIAIISSLGFIIGSFVASKNQLILIIIGLIEIVVPILVVYSKRHYIL